MAGADGIGCRGGARIRRVRCKNHVEKCERKASEALWWDDFPEFVDQRLEFLRYGIPHDIFVDVHVIVHNLTPHACDGIPWNLLVLFAELRRNSASGFANYLNEMSER